MKKLSRMDKRRIREALQDGLTQEELALIFEVSQSTIQRIAREKRSKDDDVADRMERFLGGATVDDGCYHSVPKNSEGHREPKKLPEAFIDRNDPLSILLAEEEIESREE